MARQVGQRHLDRLPPFLMRRLRNYRPHQIASLLAQNARRRAALVAVDLPALRISRRHRHAGQLATPGCWPRRCAHRRDPDTPDDRQLTSSTSHRVGSVFTGHNVSSQPSPTSQSPDGASCAFARSRSRNSSIVFTPTIFTFIFSSPALARCMCASLNPGITKWPPKSIDLRLRTLEFRRLLMRPDSQDALAAQRNKFGPLASTREPHYPPRPYKYSRG